MDLDTRDLPKTGIKHHGPKNEEKSLDEDRRKRVFEPLSILGRDLRDVPRGPKILTENCPWTHPKQINDHLTASGDTASTFPKTVVDRKRDVAVNLFEACLFLNSEWQSRGKSGYSTQDSQSNRDFLNNGVRQKVTCYRTKLRGTYQLWMHVGDFIFAVWSTGFIRSSH